MHFVCPWHGYEYDIKTGECAADRSLKLKSFEVVQARGGYLCRRKLKRARADETKRPSDTDIQSDAGECRASLCGARGASKTAPCPPLHADAATATDVMVTVDGHAQGRQSAAVRARHVAGLVGK